DRSLVQAENDGRFTLHPLLRQFAREKCHEMSLCETGATRHARWFHQLLEQGRDARAAGDPVLDRCHVELANCHAAWRWSIARHDVGARARAAAPLLHFYLSRGRLGDGLVLFAEAAASLDLDNSADHLAAAHVLLALARLQNKRGALRDA